MRYAIVKNQLAVNIIEWDGIAPLDVDGELIEATGGAGIGWTYDGQWQAPPPKPPVIPQEITMRQARLVLLQEGLLSQVDAAIEAMSEPERTAAKIEWEYSATLKRDHQLVVSLTAALGLTAAQVDALFVAAAKT